MDRPPITKSIDVWALGVTLYCLLFGRTPFAADKIVPNASEWMLYECIANDEWEVPETMGWDCIPTGGRPAAIEKKDKKEFAREKTKANGTGKTKERSTDEGPDGEGPGIVRLLEKFLQKDPAQRITLDEVKLFPLYTDPLPPIHSAPSAIASPITTSTSSQSLAALSNVHNTPTPSTTFRFANNRKTSQPKSNVNLKTSSFILTDLKDPNDWLRRTSPHPLPRITASSNEASEAMSAVRFRADWGTRLVRHFSFWLKRTRVPPEATVLGSIASGSTVVGSGIGAKIDGAGGRRITGAHAHSPSPSRRMPAGGQTGKLHVRSTGAITETDSRAALHDSTRRNKGKTRAVQAPPSPPQQQQEPRLYKLPSKSSKKSFNQPHPERQQRSREPDRNHTHTYDRYVANHSSSPVEGKSIGWWRRNVAGILTWSPDKFDARSGPRDAERQRKKEEKQRARREKKGKMKDVAVGIGSSEYEEEEGEVFDPLATSRTFDEALDEAQYSYHPQQQPPNQTQSYSYTAFNYHREDLGRDQSGPNVEAEFGVNSVLAPPSTRRSEEALRMYRPSPSSSDSISRAGGGGLLTAARRASSWGQGDEGGFEIQSVRSMDAAQEQEMEVMLVGAGGVQNQGGVVVPDPTSAATSACASPGGAASDDEGDMRGMPQPVYSGSTGDYVVRPTGTLTHVQAVGMTSGGTVVEGLKAIASQPGPSTSRDIPASGTSSTVKELERRPDAPKFELGNMSTISSGRSYNEDDDDDESGSWQRGSEFASLEDDDKSRRSRRSRRSMASTGEGRGEYDEDGDELSSQDPHYDDDDDGSSDHAVTFSPRRRPVQHDGDVDAADLRL